MCFKFSIVLLMCVCLVKGELKHVFVTVREAEHTPKNHEGGHRLLEEDTKSILTERGIDTAFNMGRFLAEKYADSLKFNSSNVSCDEYELFSTKDEIDRLTALVLGAGLRNEESEKYKNWTAEELDSIYSDKTDEFLKFFERSECPAFFKELKKKTSEFATSVKKMQSKSLVAIVKKFGAKVMQDPKKLWLTYLTLDAMKNDPNTKLPDWASDEVMKDLKQFCREFFKIAGSTEQLKRLSGGRRLSTILTEIVQIIAADFENDYDQKQNRSSIPKLSILSAPQSVLAAQIAAFSIKESKFRGKCVLDNVYPEQGAMHILELYCDDEVWTIRILYKTSEESTLDIVYIQDQQEVCEVYEFVQLMLPHFVTEEEFHQECRA